MNHNSVKKVPSQKYLGMYLDAKLNFQEHLSNVLSNVNKTIGLLWKLQALLPRQSLVTVYKTFIRPHLDYGDIIYDQTYSHSFRQKTESIQYNAALAIAGAIRVTSRKKLYQEKDTDIFYMWCRKLCYFFKIFKGQFLEYLFTKLPSISKAYNTRTNNKITLFSLKHNFFINSLFFHQLSLNGIT